MKRSRALQSDSSSDSDHSESSNCDRTTKYAGLDTAHTTGLDNASDHQDAMRCFLPPHKDPLSFSTYAEYEVHYNKYHTNRCLECRKNFPSDHLLTVHIEECHDPLVAIKRDKGEHTFSCFVEGCERKCLTHQKRRMHMIDKHMYPKNFFFAITKQGIDGRRSLLVEGSHQRRRSSASVHTSAPRQKATTSVAPASGPSEAQGGAGKAEKEGQGAAKSDPDEDKPDEEMADLAGAMSNLQFVPPSVRFGRGRAGFAKR